MRHYPKPDRFSQDKINIELDLSNYVINLMKKTTVVDTSDFAATKY